MKRAIKKKSSIYDYLEPVLETGSETDIALARKKYWQEYKRNWRKQRRAELHEFTVSYTNKELQIITMAANKHIRSCTKFIKEAAMAYCRNEFLVTDPLAVSRVRELLALNYNSLQQLSEENILLEKEGKDLLDKMTELEKKVLATLQYPQSLEQYIIEAVSREPKNKTKIMQVLQTLPE